EQVPAHCHFNIQAEDLNAQPTASGRRGMRSMSFSGGRQPGRTLIAPFVVAEEGPARNQVLRYGSLPPPESPLNRLRMTGEPLGAGDLHGGTSKRVDRGGISGGQRDHLLEIHDIDRRRVASRAACWHD